MEFGGLSVCLATVVTESELPVNELMRHREEVRSELKMLQELEDS